MTPTAAAILFKLRLSLLRNAWAVVSATSRARLFAIVVSCGITWASLFVFSMYAFSELKSRFNFPLDGLFQELLFDVMFFFLSSLLLFSTAILLYGGVFSSQESRFLLTTPLPDDHIFAYKLQDALSFSNWGFLLLGSPILIAYGLNIETGAPWSYFAALPLFFLGFVLIPGSAGAILCLLLANHLPRNFGQLLRLVGVLAALAAFAWVFQTIRSHSHGFHPNRQWFESFINQLAVMRGDLKPNHWVAAGLAAAARGETATATYYLGLVWSNGLLLYVTAVWIGKHLVRRGVERAIAGGSILGNRVRSQWLDILVERSLFFLDEPTRLLIVKDFRTFRRDPAQWLQISIFVALLVFYFISMRAFFDREMAGSFKVGISLLTLTATSLLMCAYTGRFIFPLLSLEGRTFWLLGLLPLNRSRLVWGKFAFAACTCFFPCAVLILTCDLVLGISAMLVGLHLATVLLISLGLSGLSVSMGTFMPNFRESDPSKIAIGFGGTLNLVLGFFYILTVICLVALPMHLIEARPDDIALRPATLVLVYAAAFVGGALALAATFLPLRSAARQLERMEF